MLMLTRLDEVRKLHYPVDAIGYDGSRLHSIIEAKVRKNPRAAYPTYMISMEKFARGVAMAEALHCDFVIAVQWSDAFGCYTHTKAAKHRVAMGGRTDRGDAQDIEPVVHIPIEDFWWNFLDPERQF